MRPTRSRPTDPRGGLWSRHPVGLLAAVLLAAGAAYAPPWIALAYGAFSYPVTAAREAANVVVHRSTVYASRGADGVEVLGADGRRIATWAPPPGTGSVDDLAVADDLLFVLDARPPGFLSVFALDAADRARLASPAVAVAVGPFSGVSAGGGRVIVSGGTSELSLRSYDRDGRLEPTVVSIDLGRGQPDVLLAADGTRAFVSTHFWGPTFGLTTIEVGGATASLDHRGTLGLDTPGFTAGGAKPASFPLEAALEGAFLFIAHEPGVAVVSVESLAKPRLMTIVDVGVVPVNVDVRDGLAATVGSSPRPTLVLLDVRTAASPRVLQVIPLPAGSRPTGVAIGGSVIAVAAGAKGVLLFPVLDKEVVRQPS